MAASAHHPFSEVALVVARAKFLFLLAALASMVLALLFLRAAEYRYSAEYKVIPAQGSSAPSNNPLAGLASVAGVNLSGGSNVPPLDLYLEQLKSRAVADQLATRNDLMRRIFAGEWNAAAGQWEPPRSRLRSIVNAVKSAAGLPVPQWRAPDGARLQMFIADAITVERADRTMIATVSMDHADPAFAAEFLGALHRATDGLLRRSALQKSGQYIAYLRTAIPQVQITEARIALADLLAEQEKVRMIASSSSPYAADLLDPPHATTVPTSPKALVVILGMLLLGVALTLAVVLIRYQLRPAD